jgi:hypothetical protein
VTLTFTRDDGNQASALEIQSQLFPLPTDWGAGVRISRGAKLLETREAITHGWLDVADALDARGEVRHFARHLPCILTDKERVAAALIQHLTNMRQMSPSKITRVKGD